MKTKRAMISFVDRKYEYIAAEATRTLSLQADEVHDDEDHLLVGSRTIRREEGICSVAVDGFISRLSQKDLSGKSLQAVVMWWMTYHRMSDLQLGVLLLQSRNWDFMPPLRC